ncbi:uncharacterized protein LOC108158042 [Drosophila miranda]|uniref:uncharacterized protein LOC108158042 n=1 Tax=Drosophila miranda TaxID=7229 RepID=UPI00143F4A45|nr:uncharacterized protein LOC108158042 [Drosophila miranda]
MPAHLLLNIVRHWSCHKKWRPAGFSNSFAMTSERLVVVLLCLGQVTAQLSNLSIHEGVDLEEKLLRLLLRLRVEQSFDTLVIYGEECAFHSMLRHSLGPTVLVSSGSTESDWNFSSSTLILSCGASAEREGNYRTLIKLQMRRRLLYLTEDIQPEEVCDNYSLKEQYNIAMVKADFVQSGSIYACRCFQELNFEELELFDHKSIFVEQFRNMRGATMKTLGDQLAPRCISYRDEKTGEDKMVGYVANLINSFAQKVNATLDFRFVRKDGEKVESVFKDIVRWVKEDRLDLGTTMVSSLQVLNLDSFSYPYLLTSYCLMVPIPARLPYNQIYAVIVDPLVLCIILVLFYLLSALLIYSQQLSWRGLTLANILLNDKSLRGLLGQSFPFPRDPSRNMKLVFFILCFASLMITTMYESYLQSFFTRPPPEPSIRTFQDIANSRHKLAISRFEMNVLSARKSSNIHLIRRNRICVLEDHEDFVLLRNSFNDSYVYTVSEDRWSTYQEQQRMFAQPLFYYSLDLCFNRFLLFHIPLRPHLPYRHLFEEHMQRQQEFGLVKFWKSRSFFDMVRLGLTPMRDSSPPPYINPSILVNDISWILKLYGAAMGISCCCFILELWFWRRRRKPHNGILQH